MFGCLILNEGERERIMRAMVWVKVAGSLGAEGVEVVCLCAGLTQVWQYEVAG